MIDTTRNGSSDVIDLADVIRAVVNRWPLVAATTIVGALVAVGVVLVASPRFTTNASLILKPGSSSSGGSSLASAIGALAGSGTGGSIAPMSLGSGVETELDVLKSRALGGAVVDSLGLQAQVTAPRGMAAQQIFVALDLPGSFRIRRYDFTPIGTQAGPRRFRFSSDGDTGTVSAGGSAKLAIGSVTLSPDVVDKPFAVQFRDREETITRLSRNLAFDRLKTDVAHFSYTGDDSLTAAQVPNLLMDLYLARRRGIDRGINQRRAEFLEKQADSVGRALAGAEQALRAQREATGTVDPLIVAQTEFENANRLRLQLIDLRVQEGALTQLVNDIKSGTVATRQLGAYPQFLGGTIIGMVGSLITVETQKRALLVTRTEHDQDVRALTAQQRNLEETLLPLAQQSLTGIVAQRSAIESRLQNIEQSLTGTPRNAESYTRLEREIVERGQIFGGLQTQLVDARLAAITEGGDVRALDRPVAPKKRSFPRPVRMVAAGLGGGLFFGLILAVLTGLIGGRMYDAREVERRTGLTAVRFETASPLLVGGQMARTVLVAPINTRASARPVAERLVETALSRSLAAAVLDLTNGHPRLSSGNGAPGAHLVSAAQGLEPSFDANAAIRRLEETNDLVVVHLPDLASHAAGSVLSNSRPVLLVAPERRIERDSLQSAIDLLRRIGAPCAGVVLHGDDRRSLRA